jgi:hypothetical protein
MFLAIVDTTEAKQVTSAASSLLCPEVDLGVVSNVTYTREDFEPVLSHNAFDNEVTNAGAKPYQCVRGDSCLWRQKQTSLRVR